MTKKANTKKSAKSATTEAINETPMEVSQQSTTPIDETPADPTTEVLKQYAEFWNANCAGKSITTTENAKVLWEYWQRVSGRTDRFFGCTPCIVNKLRWMKKQCEDRGIDIK